MNSIMLLMVFVAQIFQTITLLVILNKLGWLEMIHRNVKKIYEVL